MSRHRSIYGDTFVTHVNRRKPLDAKEISSLRNIADNDCGSRSPLRLLTALLGE